MKNIFAIVVCMWIGLTAYGQEKVFQTFKDTRVINTHSTETLKAGRLDFRVSHRFGDMFGGTGGWQTFYGLENASDVLIGLELGVKDNFMIGLSRTAGSSELKQNLNGMFKLRLMQQENGGNKSFSISVLGLSSMSTMQSGSEGTLSFFEKQAHRLSYHLSMIAAKKFSPYFSIQVNGAWTYRNLVGLNDNNDLISVGLAGRLQVTRSMGLILDASYPISGLRTSENGFSFPLGVGLEWDTGGGHIFQINLTNATGLAETDFIPYTRSSWLDGEFRLGFTISRLFTL